MRWRDSCCYVSRVGYHPDISNAQIYRMHNDNESIRQAILDALNELVQKGLVEVVSIADDHEPSYRLASWITSVRFVSKEFHG